MAGLVAAGTAALVLGGALPAAAIWKDGCPHIDGCYYIGEVPPEQLDAALEVTGWPEEAIFAGDEFTLTLQVDNTVLGAPSLEGQPVGVGYGSDPVGYAYLDADGNAEVTVRPLATGPLVFTPFFIGDEEGTWVPVTGDSGTVTVESTPAFVDFEVDPGLGEAPLAYGGGTLTVYASVTSLCAADADMNGDEAAAEACAAQYGDPSGTLLLMRDGEVVDETEVVGSSLDANFAEPGADLGAGDDLEHVVQFDTPVPDILLGSPDFYDYSVAFDPSNWFGSDVQTPEAVEVTASPTDVEVFVGEDLADPSHSVAAASVELTAFVSQEAWWAAPLDGTVTFYADGEAISEPQPLEEGIGSVLEWTPETGSGEYLITAAFSPATLNHTASKSDEYPLTVILPPAPNPIPEDGGDRPSKQDPASQDRSGTGQNHGSLAKTGAPSLLEGAVALLLAAAGLGGLALLRRRMS